jgi:hypothetical protein
VEDNSLQKYFLFTKEELAMTTYKTTTYETAEDLRNAINSDLAALAYPFAVKHRTYGEGQLTFVKAPLMGGSLYATIDFTAGTKTLSLDMVFINNLLEMPEILLDILLEAQTVFKADFIERENAQRIADRQARAEAEAAKKKALEDKKNEEKYQKAKAKAIKDFEVLTQSIIPKSTVDEFYYSLGWLAKNAGTFSAALPDYLLPAFERQFGTDYKPTVVDSKKKTINGNPMQWAMSMKASLSKKALDLIPTYLTKFLSSAGNAIADTELIWDLVENYGFQFGKKQDVEKVRASVPSDYLSFFEAGLA